MQGAPAFAEAATRRQAKYFARDASMRPLLRMVFFQQHVAICVRPIMLLI